MTKNQISHMVNRFLAWRFPANFNPDGGISFRRPNYAPEVDARPSGTNLLDATQATEMVEHMVAGLPGHEETGWLIERKDAKVPTWWGPPCSRWHWQQALVTPDLWTTDANKAVRFARKEDAEATIRFEGFERVAIATDHMWF